MRNQCRTSTSWEMRLTIGSPGDVCNVHILIVTNRGRQCKLDDFYNVGAWNKHMSSNTKWSGRVCLGSLGDAKSNLCTIDGPCPETRSRSWTKSPKNDAKSSSWVWETGYLAHLLIWCDIGHPQTTTQTNQFDPSLLNDLIKDERRYLQKEHKKSVNVLYRVNERICIGSLDDSKSNLCRTVDCAQRREVGTGCSLRRTTQSRVLRTRN